MSFAIILRSTKVLTAIVQTVDVIIPTFENCKMLLEAVNSCKNQSHPISLIIVVDDGSSESIRKSLEQEYENDPAVKLIFVPHSGLPGVARSIGIQNSTADWIAFLDSDDTWEPNKIELQLNLALKSQAALIYSNARVFGEKGEGGNLLPNLPNSLSFRQLAKSNFIINSSVLVRREVFSKSLTYATSLRVRAAEDYATWLRIKTKYSFAGIDLPLTNYRISDTSIRRENDHDPRIYALADFIMWTLQQNSGTLSKFRSLREVILFSKFRSMRKIVLKEMRRNFL